MCVHIYIRLSLVVPFFFEPFLLLSVCGCAPSFMTAVVSFVLFVFLVGFRSGAKFVCEAPKLIWGYVPPISGRLWSCLCV